MTDLIAVLSTGKGTWSEISRLIKNEWNRIFLITNEFGREKFTLPENAEFIVVDSNKEIGELRDNIIKSLKGKITDLEVGLNIISGTGKEHMAVLCALMKMGIGFRLVSADEKEGVLFV